MTIPKRRKKEGLECQGYLALKTTNWGHGSQYENMKHV